MENLPAEIKLMIYSFYLMDRMDVPHGLYEEFRDSDPDVIVRLSNNPFALKLASGIYQTRPSHRLIFFYLRSREHNNNSSQEIKDGFKINLDLWGFDD